MNEKYVVISSRLSLPEFKIVEVMGNREGLRTSELIRLAIREAAEKRGLYSVGEIVMAKNSDKESCL